MGETLANAFDLPKELVVDIPKITLIGNQEMSIESHKGIIQYTSEKIRISIVKGELIISGKDLFINSILLGYVVVMIRGSLNSSFENYETETSITRPPKLPYIQISGEIVNITCHEINLETRTYEKEEVIPLIKERLIESFNIPADAKIVDQEIQLLVESDQSIVIKLIVEAIEDIVKLSPID